MFYIKVAPYISKFLFAKIHSHIFYRSQVMPKLVNRTSIKLSIFLIFLDQP
jgi:hypothetical protein